MKRTRIWQGILVIFLAEIYSIALFVLKKDLTLTQKAGYGFTMLAFLLLLLTILLPEEAGRRVPLLSMTSLAAAVFYLLLQFLLGGCIPLLLPDFPVKAAVLVYLILLAAYVIVALSLFAGGSHIRQVKRRDEKQAAFSTALADFLQDLGEGEADPVLKKQVLELAEQARYGEPSSPVSVSELEDRIWQAASSLSEEMKDGMTDRAGQRADRIRQMLKERDREIMAE